MTNQEIFDIALTQSAIDLNCDKNDFMKNSNKIVNSIAHDKARKYLKLPFECNLVSYGNNIVASVRSDVENIVKDYIDKYPIENCFETPNIHVLNDSLEKHGLKICFMAEYFLPDMNVLEPLNCKYKMKILNHEDFKDLYTSDWNNALCERRKELDIIAIGAYDNDKLIGLAGASADCEDMWQIGIDVLKEYRKQGIASALTSNLALEIIKHNKVPFYCAAWSNIRSVRNAIKSGFRPAWVEMSAKSIEFVNNINS